MIRSPDAAQRNPGPPLPHFAPLHAGYGLGGLGALRAHSRGDKKNKPTHLPEL